MSITRRAFLASAAIAATAQFPAPRRKLREFTYSQVRLTGGPLAAMYRRTHAHFLTLDEDRLLKVYRQRAKLPAPGRDMGGWYDAKGFVPGHLLGQFISGLSRVHANTGDREAAAKARRLVEGYAAAFAVDGNPYASPVASTTWPCYILDKYEIGLLDAANFAGITQARELLPKVIEGAIPFIPDHTYDRTPDSPKQAPYDEPYILSENLFKAHELTGQRRFLDMAKLYLLNKEFFDPLSEGNNILPGKHGYSHVIALSSGAKAYEVLGDTKYLRAIRNAWDMLEQTQQYASGAWAPKETFVKPHTSELAESLTATRDHFETPCCYYSHAKLARYLTGITGESRYGDGLERVLLNTILGAIEPDNDGGYFYYSDYQSRAQKTYYKRKWPCCAGTLLQSVADFPIELYFHDQQGVYVNLYAASALNWKCNNIPVTIEQITDYPESEKIQLRINPAASAEFALHLRIPNWLDRPALLTLNGNPANIATIPGTFATLHRRWRRGDTVELTLPFSFRAVPIDEKDPDIVAIMRGPVMLTAIDPPERLAASAQSLTQMEPVPGAPLEFTCQTATGSVRMRPFYRVQKEIYSTYFHRTS